MKRIIALILVIALCVSMISCATIAVDAPEDTSTETEEVTKKKTTKSKVTTTTEKEEKETEEEFVPVEYKSEPVYDGTKNFDPFDSNKFSLRGIATLTTDVNNLAATYKESDEGKVIFYGDSHFTRWSTKYDGNKNLADEIGAANVLNHGFGSSTMHDLVLNYNELIKPWKPSAIVVSSFLNDYNYPINERIQLADWFCNKASKDFPGIKLFILDYCPVAKDRSGMYDDLATLNSKLHELTKKYPNLKIIEHSKEASFYEDPQYAGTYTHVKKSFYISDEIHFSHEGYAAYTEMLKRELKDVLIYK